MLLPESFVSTVAGAPNVGDAPNVAGGSNGAEQKLPMELNKSSQWS